MARIGDNGCECIMEALEKAIEKYGSPAIMNTDQGNQYTSARCTQTLKERDIHMSTDSQGAWREDVCVERQWRSVKYVDIYLHAYETPTEVEQRLTRYFAFYKTNRPNQAHTGQTPDAAYSNQLPIGEVA
jgi:putative transposase